ncbi:hypothetical protein [Candidatus Phyllobacterium onerii]|uniref:hypothetical protein n=1 Tax=Candidatus Phyllobacterium onerii TaxID=3020828 RepID=UPI00232D2AAD|nr:hypothetical protein [Phyllobacterium sp. IY22]
MLFEQRSAAYILVREHRKRRKSPFAGRHGVNIDGPCSSHWEDNGMWYLISELWLFLLIAVLVGFYVGWSTQA